MWSLRKNRRPVRPAHAMRSASPRLRSRDRSMGARRRREPGTRTMSDRERAAWSHPFSQAVHQASLDLLKLSVNGGVQNALSAVEHDASFRECRIGDDLHSGAGPKLADAGMDGFDVVRMHTRAVRVLGAELFERCSHESAESIRVHADFAVQDAA